MPGTIILPQLLPSCQFAPERQSSILRKKKHVRKKNSESCGNDKLIQDKSNKPSCSLSKNPGSNSLILPQECTAHPQHTLTQALVWHDDVSVVLALLLPTLAPAVNADGLVGFYHVGDLKVWVHLGNSTDREVSLQKGQRMCRAAPTRVVRLILYKKTTPT